MNSSRRKKILVTGASGFIGNYVLQYLKEGNGEIHAVASTLHFPDKNNEIHWHTCNLHQKQAVNELIFDLKPEKLIHLAWYTRYGKVYQSTKNIRWLISSLNLAEEFAKSGGQRLITIGTCAEYFGSRDNYNTQKSIVQPSTLYGVTKNSLFNVLSQYFKNIDLSYAHARVFFAFGSGENVKRLIPSTIIKILNDEEVYLKNKGKVRDYIYVKDVAKSLVKLLNSQVKGSVDIGTGEGISTHRLVEMISKMLNKSTVIKYIDDRESLYEQDKIIADPTRLECELEYHPFYSIQSAIGEYIKQFGSSNERDEQ